METKFTGLQKKFWLLSMILAPLLIGVAQFFWKNGVLNSTAGTLQVYGFLFWIFAFQGMFIHLQDKMPLYAQWGFWIAVFACMGGSHFGVDGIYSEALGIQTLEAKDAFHALMFPGVVLVMYLPGLLFPLCLLGLGIAMLVKKTIPAGIALLLILAAIGFPLSRMPRLDWIAHIDNALLLLSHFLVAINLKAKTQVQKS